MTFRKTVGAYLTGWLIVQPLYNRLIAYWRRQHLANPDEQDLLYFKRQAEAIVDELTGDEVIAAVETALQQYALSHSYSPTAVRQIAWEAAAASSAVFMRLHPQVMPSREVGAGVEAVLRQHGVPAERERA